MHNMIKGEPLAHTALRYLVKEAVEAERRSPTAREPGSVIRCIARRVSDDAGEGSGVTTENVEEVLRRLLGIELK